MPTLVRNGQTWTLRSANGTVADLRPGHVDRGTPVQSRERNGTATQGWVFWAMDGNWVLETQLTRGRYAPGQAMVMHYDRTTRRASLADLDGQPDQRWCLEVIGDDWLRIRTLRADEGSLFLTASAPGSPLVLAERDSTDPAQRWQLIPTGGADGHRWRSARRPQPAGGDVRTEVLIAVNTERARAGSQPLHLDDRLSAAAQRHAEDMTAHDLVQDNGTDGSTPWRRVRAAGFAFRSSAENVAAADNAPEAMRMWMNSPHHRNTILDPRFSHVGVGCAPRQHGIRGRYVQTFGQV
ncbi:CAP domain-containing protein [Streptomyces sp. FH025]|uniref:CAP domain-containing protein n=1 Tax=Streptomyces sp. FH025 TaxID=2815937 RepID=UPI001A9FDA3F|nr:CAP domain-containing protein [Streptomyces sp. FH025]MBO1415962.1 CAP domain-containing protein [Streptomyces sp. FH025]